MAIKILTDCNQIFPDIVVNPYYPKIQNLELLSLKVEETNLVRG